MSRDELVLQVAFNRVRWGLRLAIHAPTTRGGRTKATPLAKTLALAHALDRAMEAGGPGTFIRLANAWGMKPQRLALIHVLVYLAPDLQEQVLAGSLEAGRMRFEDLVAFARIPWWPGQREAWSARLERPERSGLHPSVQ